MTPDPLSVSVDGMGLYEYVRSNPSYWLDSAGLYTWNSDICKDKREKIRRLQREIQKRQNEISQNPLNLPENNLQSTPYDIDTVSRHRRIIGERKKEIQELQNWIKNHCRDPEPVPQCNLVTKAAGKLPDLDYNKWGNVANGVSIITGAGAGIGLLGQGVRLGAGQILSRLPALAL